MLNYRYEYKFIVPSHMVEWAIRSIRSHPALFHRVYPDRRVNNVYYDTWSWENFEQHVNGVSHRRKYRIRWYGHEAEKPVKATFEVKKKKGVLIDKDAYDIGEINHSTDFKNIGDMAKVKDLPQLIRECAVRLQPCLVNSYDRQYYESACRIYRITVDTNIRFSAPGNPQRIKWKSMAAEENAVIELKYDHKAHAFAKTYGSLRLPFRLTAHSKYIRGLVKVLNLSHSYPALYTE